MPAGLEVFRVLFAATGTINVDLGLFTCLEFRDQLLCPFHFVITLYPYFRVGVGKRNFTEPALGVFIQYPGADAGIEQHVAKQIGLGKTGS